MKTILIAYVLVGLALAVGWVLNIIALIHMIGGDITVKFVLRVVGVFAAPLGGILGWVM